MPRLRTVRTKEEAEAVPLDRGISIELSEDKDDEKEQVVETKPEEQEVTETEEPGVPEPEDKNWEEEDLKSRYEALQKAEATARELAEHRQRQLEDAHRLAQQNQQELHRSREAETQANLDNVVSVIQAAKSEMAAARQDLRAALNDGNIDAQAEAHERISVAAAHAAQYESYRLQLEDRKEQAKSAPPQPSRQDQFEAIVSRVENSEARAFLRSNPEYITDPDKAEDLRYLHKKAPRLGYKHFSPEYFDWIKGELGMTEKKETKKEEKRAEGSIVSAPVSRDNVSMRDGKPTVSRVTLNAEEREIARASNISEIEYARQKLRMIEAKKNGQIQG